MYENKSHKPDTNLHVRLLKFQDLCRLNNFDCSVITNKITGKTVEFTNCLLKIRIEIS